MSLNTQETLLTMDVEQPDDDAILIDSESDAPQVQRIPRSTLKRSAIGISNSQPPGSPATKKNRRSGSVGRLRTARFDEEEESDFQAIMKLLTKIQKDQTSFKSTMNKEFTAIKADIQKVNAVVVEIKAKVVSVAPPTNLEGELQTLTQRVTQLAEGSSAVKASSSVRLDSVIENVDSLLNKRKMKFYDHTAYSERHAIYSQWEAMTPPFVMAKYLPTLIENEPEEEYESRKKKADNVRVCEMELLALRIQRTKTEMEKVDDEVAQRISDCDVEAPVKRQLTDEWIKLTTAEESKSKKIWEKTAKNLRETPQRQQDTSKILDIDGKTYAAAVKKPPKVKDTDSSKTSGATNPQQNQEKWSTAKGKNKKSHKENHQPVKPNTANKPTGSEGTVHTSSFHGKGPKFKPRQQWGGYQNQNQWNRGPQGPNPWGFPIQFPRW